MDEIVDGGVYTYSGWNQRLHTSTATLIKDKTQLGVDCNGTDTNR